MKKTSRSLSLFALLWLTACATTTVREPLGEPRLTFALSTNRHLELEPCGCSLGQMGGVWRESHFINSLRLEAPRRLYQLSAGTNFVPEEETFQSKSKSYYAKKAEYLVRALNELGMSAISPTAADLSLGIEAVKKLEKKASFAFVSANLADRSSHKLLFRPYVEWEVSGRTVLVTGISAAAKPGYEPSSQVEVQDAIGALKEALKALPAKSRFIVVLSDLPRNSYAEIWKAIPEVNLVVGSDEKELSEGVEQYAGDHFFVNPVSRGRAVSVMDIQGAWPAKQYFEPSVAGAYQSSIAGWTKELTAIDKKLKRKKGKAREELLTAKGLLEKKIAEASSIPMAAGPAVPTYESKQTYLGKDYEKSKNKLLSIIDEFRSSTRDQALESIQ